MTAGEMEFAPEDIADREFLSVVGGFDRKEVREFLNAVATQIRDKNHEITQLNEKVRALEASSSEGERPQTLDADLLIELQNQNAQLIVELHGLLNDALSLVAELRETRREPDASPKAEVLPASSSLPEASPPTAESATPEAPVTPRVGRPSAEPPPEWEDLLSEP